LVWGFWGARGNDKRDSIAPAPYRMVRGPGSRAARRTRC